jgi:protein XRP2
MSLFRYSYGSTDDAPVASAAKVPVPAVPKVVEVKKEVEKFKFTAPDGTGFYKSGPYRKYMFATYYSFSNKENELLCKKSGDIDGQAFNLSRLTSCEVQLLDHSDQVLADYLKDCRIFIGPSAGSVFLRNCENCSITVAAKQLRTRDCKNCRFYVYSKTEPVIEMTENVEIRRFNGLYEGMDQHFKAANLSRNVDNWDKIHDFSKRDKDLGPEPHFKLIKLVPTPWKPVYGQRTSERPRLSSVTY